MPLMYGIAAFAVLANGLDQTGVDPQIDKQYAIVKPGGQPNPVVHLGDVPQNGDAPAKSGGAVIISTQEGGPTIPGWNTSFQSAQAGVSGQTGRVDAPPAIVFSGQVPPGAQSTLTIPEVSSLFGQRTLTAPPMMAFGGDNLAHLKGMDRLVSVHFNNASAAEVMKWLSKQNVNFVANVDKLPKTHITMNVAHVPLAEALETVAESLGGSWQVKGSTIVFRMGMFGATPFSFTTPPSMKGFGGEFPGNTQLFGDMKAFSKVDPKMLEQFKAFGKGGKTFEFKMDPKMMEQFKSMGKDGKTFENKMDPKTLDQFKAFAKDGKFFEYKMDPKMMEQFKAKSKDGMAFAFGSDKNWLGAKGQMFKKLDADKLLKSLTKSQRELNKTQGYLKFSDLTDAQRAMMFDGSTKELPESFTFMISSNGEKVTIKSK